MSVNRISQSHTNEEQAIQNVNSQKSQNAETKANAIIGQNNSRIHAEPATQPQPAATADNKPASTSQEQNTGTDTKGTRLNVLA